MGCRRHDRYTWAAAMQLRAHNRTHSMRMHDERSDDPNRPHRAPRRARARTFAALALWLATACTGPVAATDLEGRPCELPPCPAGAVQVVVFTSHECPIANAYAPTLQTLAAGWIDLPVALWLVHTGPDLTPAAARMHARDYGLPGTILLDPTHHLARALGATRTPEAVVRDHRGITYRGRIDDQWVALGTRTRAATVHDLQHAVAATLAGRPVPLPHAPAVGCLLPRARAQ
jgi:hypothetical protein